VNLPGVPIPIPSLTRKDMDDLELALELGVDFVALSFVRSAADVRDLRALIEQAGSPAHVIAKIEKSEAVDALETILEDADAVMVARGDLGVEIGPALVPLVQKRIIFAALERGKPVITATQMLESMVHQAEPTRAEASDVANAILDGSSALMLSGETAVGQYPVESVAYMDRIARAIEPSLGYRHQLPEASEEPTVGQAMSNAACDLAEALGAKAILVPTYSGRTASVVARLRPRRPIIALTHHDYALRQMALEWGVSAYLIPECADFDAYSKSLTRHARATSWTNDAWWSGGHGGQHSRHDEPDQRSTSSSWVELEDPRSPRRSRPRGQADPHAPAFPFRAALARRRRDPSRRVALRAPAAELPEHQARPGQTGRRRACAQVRAARASAPARRVIERRGPDQAGAAARPGAPGRTALHSQGRLRLAPRHYDRAWWTMIAQSSSGRSDGPRGRSGPSPSAARSAARR
jgi:hypothetical protein